MLARDDMAEAMSRFEPYLCGLAGALGLLAFKRTLVANVHLDLLRLGFGLLSQLNFQHALIIVSVNAVGIHRIWQSKGASEASILPLHATVVLFLLFLFELTLAV